MAMGKLEEAIKQSRQAQKYDPLNLIVSTLIGMAFYFSRKYDESIEEVLKTLSMAPNYLPVYIWMGLSYEQKGEFGKAVEILERGKNLTKGKHPKINAMLAHAHARSGKIDQAVDQLNELILKSKHGYVSSFNISRIYLGLNKKDLALQSLSKAYEDRDTWLVWLNVDPSFDEIREDPAFADILSKMNFNY